MNFDAGTWWLALLLLGGLTGGFWFLLKRTVFERVDTLERSVGESVKKGDYDKDMKEVREDIEKIKANYITKEDFFREQAKTDRKLDRIMDILLEMKGDKKGESSRKARAAGGQFRPQQRQGAAHGEHPAAEVQQADGRAERPGG